MENPVVTVICICFNHERFVREAIESVVRQTYKPVELIVVDDHSSDNSTSVILEAKSENPDIRFIANYRNIGICRSFNRAFELSVGEYVIDLAADDMLEPERIEKSIEAFKKNPRAGVNFCDAWYIDEKSRVIRPHYKRKKDGKIIQKIPQGMVYKEILERYFICPPTMVYSRKAVEALSGYDEDLAYEDFDFQVRSSRLFEYVFTDALLVKKRVLNNSLSTQQYKPDSDILISTWKICEKAYLLNRTAEEHAALKKRVSYELRQALISRNFAAAGKLLSLLEKMNVDNLLTRFYRLCLGIGGKRRANGEKRL
jgi:glycosyltransferase involved in cell wall biosynthesis